MYLSEYEEWRLVLASRQLDRLEQFDAYRTVNEVLTAAGMSPYTQPLFMILKMTEPFIRDLRKQHSKSKSIEGLRIGGQLFGGRFVEDGYVYRIS